MIGEGRKTLEIAVIFGVYCVPAAAPDCRHVDFSATYAQNTGGL